MTNKTDSFKVSMAANVLLKAMFSVVMNMVDEKEVPSISTIRQIVYFHSLMLLFTKEYPEIITEIDKNVEDFLNNKENRTKDKLANLGLILVYTLFSEKYSFKDVVNGYFDEQLDRQVFWILLKIPELDDDKNYGTLQLDDSRVEITFQSQVVSYHMVVFYHDYEKILKKYFSSWNGMLEQVEQNSCKLETKIEDELLYAFKNVQTTVKSYSNYFEHIGLPQKNMVEINAMLKTAVGNSKKKRYHGSIYDVI
jgi:Ran GTPase-activating protein (RanGAP) involved in mRNA processing and transport